MGQAVSELGICFALPTAALCGFKLKEMRIFKKYLTGALLMISQCLGQFYF